MAASTRSKAGDSSSANNGSGEDKRSNGASEDVKPNTESLENSTTAQPLGPPPRPTQSSNDKDGGYFGQSHSSSNNETNGAGGSNKKNGGTYHAEPNPFEEQFGNPSTDTPGKSFGLPPLASLTSPSSLLPTDTPGWNSLRSGPLSPAMLAGPTGTGYFDQYGRGFPTPNESSLRTGLTPGGGGSMFPAASPGTHALFNSITINTPNTMDFMRSSMASKNGLNNSGPTSQPADAQTSPTSDSQPRQGQSANAFDNSNHPDADAANGLFLLAQSNGVRTSNGFSSMSQAPAAQMPNSMAPSVQPVSAPSAARKASAGSNSAMDDQSESEEEPPKPAPRGRKRAAAAEPKANNRRKTTDSSAKAPPAKKARNSVPSKFEFDPTAGATDDEEEEPATHHKDGRKMTDEEKRKNFLERNRVAALKCRQRKKQWLANLQNKCDLYSQENDALTHTVNQLREQVFQLKQVLITHKDCPVMASQGFNQQVIANLVNQDIMMGYVPQGGGPGNHMQQHGGR